MSWSRLDENFSQHPKVLRLAELLGCSKHEARGIIVTLWNWTVRFAKDGDLSVATPRELELALEWEGKPGALIRALIKVRLIDKSAENGDLSIHNWMRYADAWKAAQKKHTQRNQADRAQMSRDSTGTVPPTGQDRTRPDKTRPDQTRARAHDPTETTPTDPAEPSAPAELRLLPGAPPEPEPEAPPPAVIAFDGPEEAWAALVAAVKAGAVGARVLEALDAQTRQALAAIGGSQALRSSREAQLGALQRAFCEAYSADPEVARGSWRARAAPAATRVARAGPGRRRQLEFGRGRW